MQALGYDVMGAFGIDGRRYFRKTDTAGQRTHHLHVFAQGSAHIERHLAFRDYLRAHPDIANDCAALKTALTRIPTATWGSYIAGKDPFIKATEKDAIRWYRQNRRTS